MNLRQAALRVLEALVRVNASPHLQDLHHAFDEEITDLKQALAEPDSDYERGFVDGMNLQTKGSVDKAVNRMAQTTHWEGCEAVHPECRKPEQEPDGISWLKRDNDYFTAPTPRKPLTDEEMRECAQAMNAEPLAEGWPELIKFARAIENKHGIGEQHE